MYKIKAIKGCSLFPKKKFTLVTTNAEYDYEDYKEWAEEMEEEVGDRDSEAFADWCYHETQMNIDCDIDNLKSLSNYINDKFVIEGTLGLWWGNPEIRPVVMDNLGCAVLKCIGLCDNFDVVWDNGVVEVSASHHDGTNHYTIRALSAKGIRTYNKKSRCGEVFYPNEGDKKRIPYPYHIAV